jgi:hypothetical protein
MERYVKYSKEGATGLDLMQIARDVAGLRQQKSKEIEEFVLKILSDELDQKIWSTKIKGGIFEKVEGHVKQYYGQIKSKKDEEVKELTSQMQKLSSKCFATFKALDMMNDRLDELNKRLSIIECMPPALQGGIEFRKMFEAEFPQRKGKDSLEH